MTSTTNLPAAVEALAPDLLLAPPSLPQLDNWWTAALLLENRFKDALGLALYWEMRLRPGHYEAAALRVGTNFDVSTSTVTRWRTMAQRKHHLPAPDAKSAGQQRAAVVTKARNAKALVEAKRAETRFTPEQGKRVLGRSEPIDATSHLIGANGNGHAEERLPDIAPADPPPARKRGVTPPPERRLWQVAPTHGQWGEQRAASLRMSLTEYVDHLIEGDRRAAETKSNGRREVTTNFK